MVRASARPPKGLGLDSQSGAGTWAAGLLSAPGRGTGGRPPADVSPPLPLPLPLPLKAAVISCLTQDTDNLCLHSFLFVSLVRDLSI